MRWTDISVSNTVIFIVRTIRLQAKKDRIFSYILFVWTFVHYKYNLLERTGQGVRPIFVD